MGLNQTDRAGLSDYDWINNIRKRKGMRTSREVRFNEMKYGLKEGWMSTNYQKEQEEIRELMEDYRMRWVNNGGTDYSKRIRRLQSDIVTACEKTGMTELQMSEFLKEERYAVSAALDGLNRMGRLKVLRSVREDSEISPVYTSNLAV
jgi:hypothetical protein